MDILGRIEVIKWLDEPPYTPMPDLDAARRWIARLERREGGFVGEYEIGWHLHPDAHGHGFATEGARGVLDDAFARGLPDVWCGMHPDNAASRRVVERLGLPFQGVMSDPWYDGEGPRWRVTREEWLAG